MRNREQEYRRRAGTKGGVRVAAIVAVLVAAVAAGCASPPPAPPPDALLADRLFAAPRETVRLDDLFEVSEARRAFLHEDVAAQLRRAGPQEGLAQALRSRAQLKLEYDSARTKNAAQTFGERSGNCLSLVIMTAAFAKELNLPVTYQSVQVEESWSRNGALLIASGHVNITLGRHLVDVRSARDISALTIDFLPPEQITGLRTREIGESTVVAMYANNRAAEALADGHLDDAYAWAAASVRKDPRFAGAYNTLGVVYLHHGDLPEAARVFERVLAGDPRDTRALTNLAVVYERQGRAGDAQATRTRLAALEPYPPFYFFQLGMAAVQRDDWRTARDLFAREVARADTYHEFHFWLGVADWRLGDEAAARRHLSLAIDNSLTRGQHDLYAAKLEWLQAHRRQ
jgi:tetratricopeptide (TPR) repeat protein